MKNSRILITLITFLMIGLMVFTASCDKRNPPPIVPAPPEPVADEDVLVITMMRATPDVIYADNNITTSRIEVLVKNMEDMAIVGQTVNFKTNIGAIITTVATDSTGMARTTFYDNGDSGTANITAEVKRYHPSIADSVLSMARRTIQVEIVDTPPVETVHLDFLPQQPGTAPYEMSIMSQAQLYARAYLTDGSPVPNNSLITFECSQGRFVDNEDADLGQEVVVKTTNGKAPIRYDSGTTANNKPGDTLGYVKAKIGGKEASRDIRIVPGNPARIKLESFLVIDGEDVPSLSTEVGSPYEIYMQATVSDIYRNRCSSQRVDFTTDLGTFMNTTQNISRSTDEYGIARVRFTPGLLAGAATISASANNDTIQTQIVFNIDSDDVYSMDFTQEQVISINVAESGGASSAILRVKLRDINYNLVDSPYEVTFSIVSSGGASIPAGANLNGQLSPTGQPLPVTVTSNGGEAQVSVNAGTESGVLVIEASCVSNSGRTIVTRKPNVLIHAGPPDKVTPFMKGFDQAEDIGAGFWELEAGAIVRDKHNNPVSNNIPVWFYIGAVQDPGMPPLPLPDVSINAFAYVGNSNAQEDTIDGTAFTTIVYPGARINTRVKIIASSGNVTGELVKKLPLTGPQIIGVGDPQTIHMGRNSQPKTTDIIIYLTDGQGNPVKDSQFLIDGGLGQIIFNTDYLAPGDNVNNPLVPTQNYQDEPPVKTRIYTDVDGMAHSRLKIYKESLEYPAQPGDPPMENLITITVWLVEDSQNEQLQFMLNVWAYDGAQPPFNAM